MLVLSRKASEKIHIGDNISIEVRRIAGNRVTIAIDAPKDIRILRGELNEVAREFEEASPSDDALQTETYEVTHQRISLADVVQTDEPQAPTDLGLPPNDLSDHGMSAYAVG